MALIQSADHGSGLRFEDAYWMLGAVEHQIVNRSIRIAVVGYLNAERRDQLKSASVAFEDASAVFGELKAKWEASPQGRERESAYDDYALSERALKKAAQAVNDIEALPVQAERYIIAGADYHACLNPEGDPSRALIYAWLRKQTKWLDAKEI